MHEPLVAESVKNQIRDDDKLDAHTLIDPHLYPYFSMNDDTNTNKILNNIHIFFK